MSDAKTIKFPSGRHQRRVERMSQRTAPPNYQQGWAMWEIARSLAAIADHLENESEDTE